jgi:hypothetical protein
MRFVTVDCERTLKITLFHPYNPSNRQVAEAGTLIALSERRRDSDDA